MLNAEAQQNPQTIGAFYAIASRGSPNSRVTRGHLTTLARLRHRTGHGVLRQRPSAPLAPLVQRLGVPAEVRATKRAGHDQKKPPERGVGEKSTRVFALCGIELNRAKRIPTRVREMAPRNKTEPLRP
jgi:hypothetical protein